MLLRGSSGSLRNSPVNPEPPNGTLPSAGVQGPPPTPAPCPPRDPGLQPQPAASSQGLNPSGLQGQRPLGESRPQGQACRCRVGSSPRVGSPLVVKRLHAAAGQEAVPALANFWTPRERADVLGQSHPLPLRMGELHGAGARPQEAPRETGTSRVSALRPAVPGLGAGAMTYPHQPGRRLTRITKVALRPGITCDAQRGASSWGAPQCQHHRVTHGAQPKAQASLSTASTR